MAAEEKTLEDKVKNLQKAVEALIELETVRTKLEIAKSQAQMSIAPVLQEEAIDKEALMEDLKEVHLGELVIYALDHNLIKRKTASKNDED